MTNNNSNTNSDSEQSNMIPIAGLVLLFWIWVLGSFGVFEAIWDFICILWMVVTAPFHIYLDDPFNTTPGFSDYVAAVVLMLIIVFTLIGIFIRK